MAKLQYPLIIETDPKYRALAELSLGFTEPNLAMIMTNLVDVAPVAYLDLLAEKWSVTGYDGWLLAESEDAKRNLIKRAVELHRHKGTPWAMREIIRQLGFGEIEIIEGLFDKQHDGAIRRDGTYFHGDRSKWAHYRVILQNAITNDQAELLRKTLRAFAPARCILASLDYRAASLRHNGKAIRNGQFNRGTA